MTTKTMLLNNVTAIDVGFLTAQGVFGASVRPSFLITGEMSEDEQVVVDFSTIKKSIKELIDHKELGIDHKTIVIGPAFPKPEDDDDFTVTMGGPVGGSVRMTAPEDAFVFLSERCPNALSEDWNTKGKLLSDCVVVDRHGGLVSPERFVIPLVQELLSRELPKLFPTLTDIKVFYSKDVTAPLQPSHIRVGAMFKGEDHNPMMDTLVEDNIRLTYSHGLPRSTSWGCQNILHGHVSVVTLAMPHSRSDHTQAILLDIRHDLAGKYLVAERDVIPADDEPSVLDDEDAVLEGTDEDQDANSDDLMDAHTMSEDDAPDEVDDVAIQGTNIGFESMSRGSFSLFLPHGSTQIKVMPTDTTVENIAQYIWDTHVQPAIEAYELTDVSMYVSEGLDKGAFIRQQV
ncbi:hypothetical protein KoPa5_00018 [Pseudomonas phage vB_PpuM-KoPa-5]